MIVANAHLFRNSAAAALKTCACPRYAFRQRYGSRGVLRTEQRCESRGSYTSSRSNVHTKMVPAARAFRTSQNKLPGVTYCFFGNIYVSLTNESNAELTMLAANGPGFEFPPGTGFEPLPDGKEPTGKEAAHAALQECQRLDEEEGKVAGGREIVFAGLGEPLVRLPALLESLELLKNCPEVRALRLNTNGLVPAADAHSVAKSLQNAGVASVCVQLQTADPDQHCSLVKPAAGLSFHDACNFVTALVKVGIPVECTAVSRPDVDVEAVRALATGTLQATSYKSRPYFP